MVRFFFYNFFRAARRERCQPLLRYSRKLKTKKSEVWKSTSKLVCWSHKYILVGLVFLCLHFENGVLVMSSTLLFWGLLTINLTLKKNYKWLLINNTILLHDINRRRSSINQKKIPTSLHLN